MTISNFLKNVFQDIKQQTRNNYLFLPLLLVLITIPMRYAYNSITTGVFIGISILAFKKRHFRIEKSLIVPIAIYLLMLASLLWTTDLPETKSALFKMFPVLLLPVCFMINKPFSQVQIQKIITYYGYSFVLFALFYLGRAIFRYVLTKDSSVFFYHGLVTEDVNAIHISTYMVLAYFSFMIQANKTVYVKSALLLLATVIVLLSSKNLAVVFLILNSAYFLYYFNNQIKRKLLITLIGFGLVVTVVFFQELKNRFEIEIASNLKENTINREISKSNRLVYNVTVGEAWRTERFDKNDFFPGTALRVYQFRIFNEMMQADQVFLTGYGLNATKHKIKEKRIEHNLYEGYDEFNFHNQYIQFFAELGVLGFLLIVTMVLINLKNGLNNKDFIHISFAVLMISLFLTESFLSRQRGIIFFMMLYCLFNASIRNRLKKEIE